MNENLEDEKVLRQYLLGQLSVGEQVGIEARLFLNSKYEQMAQGVKDDLVDDYAYENLTESERLSFESHFLARLEHRADLKIAVALKRLSDSQLTHDVRPAEVQTSSHRPSIYERWLSFLKNKRIIVIPLAAAILLVFAAVMWLVIRSVNQDRERRFEVHDQQPTTIQPAASPQQGQPEGEQAGNDKKSSQQETVANGNKRPIQQRTGRQDEQQQVPSTPETQNATLAFVIPPSVSVRSGTEYNRIVVPLQPIRVTLKFPLITDDYKSYRGRLQSRGNTIQRWSNLIPEVDEKLGKIVKIEIASTVFREQSYVMKLRGVDADLQVAETDYPFQVQRK